MIVEKTRRDGHTVVTLEGTIRLGESAEFFSRTLQRTLDDDSGNVLIDFSGINYIDSTGVGELVGYLQRFRREQRQLLLVNPSERIVKLLEMANLTELLPAYPTVEAALKAGGAN
jgi:anti-anti-sigma factor